jgi:voltage-gated potassium channel Kch
VTPYKGLLLGLFFISVGMSANLTLLAAEPLAVLGLAALLVVLKVLVVTPIALIGKIPFRESLRTGIVLSQGGEFAFVLLTAGIGAGVVAPAHAEMAILVVTLSMVSTPILVSLGDWLLARGEPKRQFDAIETPPKNVVIAGFGRFAQIIARILTMRGIPFTALESSPGQVDVVRAFGNEIFYGDATRLDLLRNAHVADASAFVIAVDNVDTSLRIASLVRETCPNVTIMARARDRDHEIRLRELGVTAVIRDTLLSSLSLTADLLKHLGFSDEESERSILMFREHDERTLLRQAAVYHDQAAYRETAIDAARQLRELFREDATVVAAPKDEAG